MNDEVLTPEGDNMLQQQSQMQQSKRMRSMDQSLDECEYHSANDESFGNSSVTTAPLSSPATTPATTTTTTLAARKQLTPADPNEPAKPLSAYALFFRDTVSAIKQQNPNCSFQELSRIVASMWEALDLTHKNFYNKKNETARTEYIKQMRIYRQQQTEAQHLLEQQQLEAENDLSNNNPLQTKPAVFTIARSNSAESGGVNQSNNQMMSPSQQQQQTFATSPQYQQQQQPAQFESNNTKQDSQSYANTTTSNISNNNNNSAVTTNDPSPEQIQMLAEAGAVQKCTRENCNKRAIINPDWEDEYCSNECVVIHCRNIFNSWVQSNLEARKQ